MRATLATQSPVGVQFEIPPLASCADRWHTAKMIAKRLERPLETVEEIRKRFLPERITTLFVGESAPHSGDFFYYGNSAMLAHMKRAVELAFGKSDDFLKSFQAYGWYLDDLVLEPVNHLSKPKRIAKCLDAQKSLADRIETYMPEAIVSVLKSIEPFVNAAARMAGSKAPLYGVPFPGMGQQPRFRAGMAAIIQKFPRLTELA
jgi:hypothetical protein